MSATDSPDATTDASDLRAAQRTLALFGVAVVAIVAGGLAVLMGAGRDDPSTLGGGDGEEVAVAIGPEPGADLGPYIAGRREALIDAEGRRAAVVSFHGYVAATDADRLIGDEAEVIGYLVALPGDGPRLARSVTGAREAALDDAEAQLEAIEPLVPTVEDPEFAEFYRAELIRYRKVVNAGDRDDVVFGVVVRGRSADLRAVASREGVRLVDVGSGAAISDATGIVGLRPDEAVTAGSPRFRP